MDELKNIWKNVNQMDEAHENENIKEIIKLKSQGPIEKLDKQLFAKILFVIICLVLMGIFLPFSNSTISSYIIVGMMVLYVAFGILIQHTRKKLKDIISLDSDVHSTLVSYYDKTNEVLRIEERAGLFLYPISATAGFLIGLGGDTKLSEWFSSTTNWIVFLVVIFATVPLAHFSAKWMNKVAFGKYMNQLKENIKLLESEK